MTVRQRDTGSGCNQDLLMATSNTDASGNASYVLPFGTYRVCVSGRASTSSTTIRFRQTSRHHRHHPGPAPAAAQQPHLRLQPPAPELRLVRSLLDRDRPVMRRRLHRLRSDESGFTLVELLAAMSIGIIILMAAFMLLDRATAISQEIANRQEALQRGRVAMEQIVRELRSQVCLGDEKEPIRVAQDNLVTFYLDMSDGSKQIEQRTIRYDADHEEHLRGPLPRDRRLPGPRLRQPRRVARCS